MKLTYPKTKKDESVKDIYKSKSKGEVTITDPYRWLENPNDEETKNWVKEQNKVTREFLDSTDNLSQLYENELLERVNYTKFGFHVRRNENILFYQMNTGLLNQYVVYLKDLNTNKEMVFLDPNEFSKEGTWSLSRFTVSPSGKYVIVGSSEGGSDWVTFSTYVVPRVIDENAKIEVLPDKINWTKFSSIEWTKNEKGFLYTAFPKPKTLEKDSEKGTEADINKYQKLYYHEIGQDQSKDRLVFESNENPEWLFGSEFTIDYKYLLISVSRSCDPENNLYIISNWNQVITGEEKEFKSYELIGDFKAMFSYLSNQDNKILFMTNLDAPMNRIISLELPKDLSLYDKSGFKIPYEDWSNSIKDVIPQREYLLESAYVPKLEKIYTIWLKDIQNIVEVTDMQGKLIHDIKLPCPGTISSFSCYPYHNHIYLMFESFTYPKVIFYVDANKDTLSIQAEPKITGYKSEDYECKQIFFESPKDKTKIPMFIVHKKGRKLTGDAPTLMVGYGGFNISYTPFFSVYSMYFVDKFDGIYALANIRGGGEYGQKWHKGGTLHNKQNGFDDFIGASEYLIANKYTDSAHLAINGGSNGGLLMGAVCNQRPDLFKAAICEVGVLDMLRFHKFTIGSHWSSDYGCSDDSSDFDYLLTYSPLHNIPNDTNIYPNFLCLTGDHDDRVVPAHSLKFMSQLQHQLGSKVENPLLIRVDVNAGHGQGASLSKYTKKYSDICNFLSKSFNIKH